MLFCLPLLYRCRAAQAARKRWIAKKRAPQSKWPTARISSHTGYAAMRSCVSRSALGFREGGMAMPVTRYAQSEVHMAYQVFGSGPIELVFVPGFVSHRRNSGTDLWKAFEAAKIECWS